MIMNINVLRWSLEELSNKEVQEQLWRGKIDGRMGSFSEAVCGVFDDSGLDIALEAASTEDFISEAAASKLKELGKLTDQVSGTLSPEQILSHPKLNEIRELARDALGLLPES
jgi:hypothetical protein